MADIQFYCDLLVDKELVFRSWLNGWTQGEITKALATINPVVQGKFELWNGAVTGHFLEINTNKRIRLTWRTIDFEEWMPSTNLTLDFKSQSNGSRFVVTHENIPEPMLEQFRFAWEDVYLPQMQLYFVQIKHNK